MSLILMFVEALLFAAGGAFLLAPWPFWLISVVALTFGFTTAIARDLQTERDALDAADRSDWFEDLP